MDTELNIFQTIVNDWISRHSMIAVMDEETSKRVEDVSQFVSTVIVADNKHGLPNRSGVEEIWEKYLSPNRKGTEVIRGFLFDITSEFIIRLGKTRYHEFLETATIAYSMVGQRDQFGSITPVDEFYQEALICQPDVFKANPWFLSFLLLSYTKLIETKV